MIGYELAQKGAAFFKSAYSRAGKGAWKQFDSLKELSGGNSLWDALRAVCYMEDYRKYHADPENRRFEQVLFGGGAKIKDGALARALKMIE